MTATTATDARTAIRDAVENWVVWRDSGDWERFATVWHPEGQMTATWFQGSATEFIEVSRAGMANGVHILHQLSGTSIDVAGERAIAQTKMSILQRAVVDGVEVDVTCVGRFYDFFQYAPSGTGPGWLIRRRQPIYEKDWLTVLDPGARLDIDAELLGRFPVGYRYLAYVQSKSGFEVKSGLPGLTGTVVENLYREGRDWLAGAPTPGNPV
ncbi:MAG TPA: nuclear transport factor 2 family protein [Pseudonocardiaceae bacterium]|jgi:hypothetical protein|nr:nuclear transport factor 2 family protein [Pseudonocardiaceae bacterium]